MNSVIICNNAKSGCLWLLNNFTTCHILICRHRCVRVLAIYALTVTVIDLWQSWTMVFIQDKLAQHCILCFTRYIILWHMVISHHQHLQCIKKSLVKSLAQIQSSSRHL